MFLFSCTHLSQDGLTNSLKSQFGFSSYSKMPGESSKTQDGTETKNLPDGTTIVKSPGSNHGPTLEIQPPKDNPKYPDDGIRVKVRYL